MIDVNAIVASELLNTGSFMDKQDPSIVIRVGENEFKTNRYMQR